MSDRDVHIPNHPVVQCDNWNVTDGRHQLRPVRCTRDLGHEGRHVCGSTDWSDRYGAQLPPHADPAAHPYVAADRQRLATCRSCGYLESSHRGGQQ